MSDCPFTTKEILWVEAEIALLIQKHRKKKISGAIRVVEMPAKFYCMMLVKAAVNQFDMGLGFIKQDEGFRREVLELSQLLCSKQDFNLWPSKMTLASLFPRFSCLADVGIEEIYPWITKITEGVVGQK